MKYKLAAEKIRVLMALEPEEMRILTIICDFYSNKATDKIGSKALEFITKVKEAENSLTNEHNSIRDFI